MRSEGSLISDVAALIADTSVDLSVRRDAIYGATALALLARQRRLPAGRALISDGPSCLFSNVLEQAITWMKEQVRYFCSVLMHGGLGTAYLFSVCCGLCLHAVSASLLPAQQAVGHVTVLRAERRAHHKQRQRRRRVHKRCHPHSSLRRRILRSLDGRHCQPHHRVHSARCKR